MKMNECFDIFFQSINNFKALSPLVTNSSSPCSLLHLWDHDTAAATTNAVFGSQWKNLQFFFSKQWLADFPKPEWVFVTASHVKLPKGFQVSLRRGFLKRSLSWIIVHWVWNFYLKSLLYKSLHNVMILL